MNALSSIYRAHDESLIAARDWEPTAEQIADRAAYLLPLIIAHHPEPEELLNDTITSPQWVPAVRRAMRSRDEAEIGRLMLRIHDKAAEPLAEDLASDELYRSGMLSWRATVHAALRAGDVFEWLREKSL